MYSRRHFLGAIGVPAVGAIAAPTLDPSKFTRALEAAASVEASGLSPQEVASDEVPESYRQMVEEYFRALARGGDSGQQR